MFEKLELEEIEKIKEEDLEAQQQMYDEEQAKKSKEKEK